MPDRAITINTFAALALVASIFVHISMIPAQLLLDVDVLISSNIAELSLMFSILCYWRGMRQESGYSKAGVAGGAQSD